MIVAFLVAEIISLEIFNKDMNANSATFNVLNAGYLLLYS